MDIHSYSKNGYCVVPQFISSDGASELYAEIIKFSLQQKNINKLFCYPERLRSLFDPRFYRNKAFKITDAPLSLKLLNIVKSREMYQIKKKLKINSPPHRIDSYLTEVSTDDITKWHCDQSFGGATDPGIFFNGNFELISTNPVNKFFHHLSDVKSGNGAFSYLPGSHNIGIAIRKIFNSRKLKYEPFMDLKDAHLFVSKNYKLFLSENLLTDFSLEFFLENGQKALDKTKDFSLDVKAGGMVIFNDLGFHQGTAPMVSRRLVVRYWY